MKRVIGTLALIVVVPLVVWAKRAPAPDVAPVVHDGTRYIVPNDDGRRGYVQAWDVSTGAQLWETTLYHVLGNPTVESDVQDIFVRELQVHDPWLLAIDERDRYYRVDLATGRKNHTQFPVWVVVCGSAVFLVAAAGVMHKTRQRTEPSSVCADENLR